MHFGLRLWVGLALAVGCGDDGEAGSLGGRSTSGSTTDGGSATTGSGSTITSTSTTGPAPGSTTSVASSSGAVSSSSGSGPVAEGTIDVLAYNVAGLPQGISSSDPERYIPQISPLLNAFPLVLVQEDFWYHTELTADLEHRHQSAPYSDDPSKKGIGDGLNRFADFPFEAVERVAWYDCNGQLDCASDCLARKGWSFARTTVDEGVVIDVYNLHMEAGGCPEDIEIRTNAAVDLAQAIAARSEGRPLIVAGDFNLRATDKEDVEPLMLIVEGAGLTDACDAVGCGTQLIDHVMFRSGNRVALGVEMWWTPEEFVDAEDGAPLSDHLPVAARLTYGPA